MLAKDDAFIYIGTHRSGQDSGNIDFSVEHARTQKLCQNAANKAELLDVISSLRNLIEQDYGDREDAPWANE